MTFSLAVFLYIYYGFLVVWLIFCLVAIYHMFKFGFKTFTTFASTFIFIVVAVIMLVFSLAFINGVNWDTEITILGGSNNFSLPLN